MIQSHYFKSSALLPKSNLSVELVLMKRRSVSDGAHLLLHHTVYTCDRFPPWNNQRHPVIDGGGTRSSSRGEATRHNANPVSVLGTIAGAHAALNEMILTEGEQQRQPREPCSHSHPVCVFFQMLFTLHALQPYSPWGCSLFGDLVGMMNGRLAADWRRPVTPFSWNLFLK